MALTHYLEARLRFDADLHPSHALAALFTRLHLYLVRNGAGGIAVSFPETTRNAAGEARQLGKVMRLHGTAEALTPLTQATSWGGAVTVADFGAIKEAPAESQHHRVRRVQVDSNPERLMRRAMKRKGWTEAQARENYAGAKPGQTTLPFIAVISQSTGHPFRLFLDVGMPQSESLEGAFNAYGLSQEATVPSF